MVDKPDSAEGTPKVTSTKAKTDVASVLLPKKGDVPPFEPVLDAAAEKMKTQVTQNILRSKLRRELEQEIDPEGANASVVQEVHRSVPKMLFLVGSRAVKCPRMALEDDEAEIFADALSMWMPKIDSKVYAAIVMICMTAAKILDCQDAIASRLKLLGQKSHKVSFDKKKQAVVTR